MKKRIALIGLWNITNYGDPILGYCTESLLLKNFSSSDSIEIVRVPINFVFQKSFLQRVSDALLYRLSRIVGNSEAVVERMIEKNMFKQFSKSLCNVDYIVFVGGGIIKYKLEYFDLAIETVVNIAKKNHIPVIMNGVGIEGYDSKNKRCQRLKKILKDSSIIYFSTRDDINRLINEYFDGVPAIPCELVADPAVWTSECFNIQRNFESDTIGIGIARGGIFKDYGLDFSSDDMVEFYVDMAKAILDNGYKVELFTNGLEYDNIVLYKVMGKLIDFNVKKRIPNSAKNLVEIIASYKAIITTRMHAGIIAYSLDIPALGLVWNDKIRFFWEQTGHMQNCIEIKNITPDRVLEVLKSAIKNGYNQEIKQKFRQTIKDALMRIAKMIE